MKRAFAIIAITISVYANCLSQTPSQKARAIATVDRGRLLEDVRVLSADDMKGRKAGTLDGARARAYIVERFKQIGIEQFGGSYLQPFTFSEPRDSAVYNGANVVGYVKGARRPDRYLVLTAHYDHLGMKDGNVYNGADDNASGVAVLLAAAAHLSKNRPSHSIIFAALDAEEVGLDGARAFVTHPPVDRSLIVMNVNLDMVSHSERGELYAAGTHHYPFLKPYLEALASRAAVRLLIGHDRRDLPKEKDWTKDSDHAAFHAAGIPFIYFGVEDHKDYHKPTDDFETITQDFFVRATGTILEAVKEFDRNLSSIEKQKAQPNG